MAEATGIRENVKAAGENLWSAGEAAVVKAKGAIADGDAYFSKEIAANDGSFSRALKGIASKKPVTSVLAATAVLGGTVYVGKKVFGRHSERVIRERANDNDRHR